MFKQNHDINYDGFTLIIPSVSVGNVGQFAVDLIAMSLKLKKVASVLHPAIIPVIGRDPYNTNSDTLMTSCELYANEEKKICALQLRSPLLAQEARNFFIRVIDFFKNYSLQQIVILSSSFSAEKHHISSTQFRYFSNNFINTDALKSSGWLDFNTERDGQTVIHGGGFANELFDICTETRLPCLVLFKYCSEGDNIPDAIETVTYLNKWLNLLQETKEGLNYTFPPSWNLLFGSPPPRDLY